MLLLSKIIMIVPSVPAALLTVVVIGFYIFGVFVLPIRTVEVLVVWYLPHFTRHPLQTFFTLITDIVNYGLGNFLAVTYISNFFCILHFFITDTLGRLK